MSTKFKTALITAACMALPLAWQWHRASSLETQLANAFTMHRQLASPLASSQSRSSNQTSGLEIQASNSPASVAGPGTAGDWQSALKIADPLQRMSRISSLLSSLTKENAPQVADLFNRLQQETGGQYETEQLQFLRTWGRLDGPAAMASCPTRGGALQPMNAAVAALAGWAQHAPDAARAWLEAMKPGDTATKLSLGLLDGWSLTDFDAAALYGTTLPRSTVRDEFRALLLQRALSAGGVPEALRWFDTIPQDSHNQLYKQRAFDELISAMMKQDPAGAAALTESLGRQQFMSGYAIPKMAMQLAESSPSEALRWLGTLGMGEGEAFQQSLAAYHSVLPTWSSHDINAAGTWLAANKNHPAYNAMATAHAQHVAAIDGPAAFAWVDSIRDDAARTAARESTARTILSAQGEYAGPILAAAGFGEEEVRLLRENAHPLSTITSFIDSQTNETRVEIEFTRSFPANANAPETPYRRTAEEIRTTGNPAD